MMFVQVPAFWRRNPRAVVDDGVASTALRSIEPGVQLLSVQWSVLKYSRLSESRTLDVAPDRKDELGTTDAGSGSLTLRTPSLAFSVFPVFTVASVGSTIGCISARDISDSLVWAQLWVSPLHAVVTLAKSRYIYRIFVWSCLSRERTAPCQSATMKASVVNEWCTKVQQRVHLRPTPREENVE